MSSITDVLKGPRRRPMQRSRMCPPTRPAQRLEGELEWLSHVSLGRADNIDIRFAGAVALLFNVLMVAVAMVAIARFVPRHDPGLGR